MNSAINWKVFNPENMTAAAPKSREVITNQGGKVTAWSIPLKYKYPNGAVAELQVDYPELHTSSGIKTKVMGDGKYTKYQLVGSVFLNEDDGQAFYDNFVVPFNERIIQLIVENYEVMNPPKGPSPKDKESKYRTLTEDKYMQTFFFPSDKITGQMIEGSNPMTVLNLLDFQNLKTLFTDIKKNPISDPETGKRCSFEETIDLLGGIGFTFRPRVSHTKIDCGVIYRASSSIKSSLVYNFIEGNNESYQDEVAEEAQQKYGDAAIEGFNNTLLALKKAKKEKIGSSTMDTKSSEENDSPLTGTVYSSSKSAPSRKTMTMANNKTPIEQEPEQEENSSEDTQTQEVKQKEEDTRPSFPIFPKRTNNKKK